MDRGMAAHGATRGAVVLGPTGLGFRRKNVVVLGGAGAGSSFGPRWPDILAERLPVEVHNLAQSDAGYGALQADPALAAHLHAGSILLVELPGCLNQSNPFYRVHPRRNDRLIRIEPALAALYPQIDFVNFTYTRHLASTLLRHDPHRFCVVVTALRRGWIEGMQRLLAGASGPVVLVWAAGAPPIGPKGTATPLSRIAPSFVSRSMLEALRPQALQIVEVIVPGFLDAGADTAAGRQSVSPEAQVAIAKALRPVLAEILAHPPADENGRPLRGRPS